MIKDVPFSERPREKMAKFGAEQLSNQELLAVLIRSGTKEESVLQLSQRVLYDFDGLLMLKDATIEELQTIKGIGLAKALEMRAAIELGRRIYTYHEEERWVIRSPEDVSGLVMEEMRFLTQEHFVILCLNTKNQVIHRQTLFIGSLNSSIVHPREVFKEALRRSAAAVICIHNHPSGDPGPSREDIDVTKRLIEAGRILGIDVLDHIIIGDRRFTSLKEQGSV
ncbi:RadC family protein [Salibacterium lacus]|uniref:DNA repair protein RadC n=1 Tax=Salibacterium lacus TaxID=1898109 RepID=A0ABW5T0Z8_9BACI